MGKYWNQSVLADEHNLLFALVDHMLLSQRLTHWILPERLSHRLCSFKWQLYMTTERFLNAAQFHWVIQY